MNFIISITIVLLTLQGDIVRMKLYYIIENVTLILHTKMGTS